MVSEGVHKVKPEEGGNGDMVVERMERAATVVGLEGVGGGKWQFFSEQELF